MKPHAGEIESVIFDLDGVIYRGAELREGVLDVLKELRAWNINFHFLTNTSVKTTRQIQQKLSNFGLDVPLSSVTTSSEVAAHYLKRELGQGYLVLTAGGSEGLSEELANVDMRQVQLETIGDDELVKIASRSEECCLLTAWSDRFDYQVVSNILYLSESVEGVFSTDDDREFASGDRNLPGTAWINGAVQRILLKKPLGLGKPHPFSVDYVLNKMDSLPDKTIMIGDNIESDIAAGQAANLLTCLVLGGATTNEELCALPKHLHPDFIISELLELLPILETRNTD